MRLRRTRVEGVQVQLPRGYTLRIAEPRGARITCIQGAVWITRLGDPCDYVIGPGEEWCANGDGLALVSAFRASRLGIRRAGRPVACEVLDEAQRRIPWDFAPA